MIVIALVAACGPVRDPGRPDAPDTPGAMATVYRGMLNDIAPVTFGGGKFCTYSITLRQIDVQVTMQPSGQVIGAEARNLNVETAVPPCVLHPLDPSIAAYTLASATTTPEELVIALRPAPTNRPMGTLQLRLVKTGDAYLAHFEYHRTDQAPPLDWSVAGSLALSPQSAM
jgi:hypothetical protein